VTIFNWQGADSGSGLKSYSLQQVVNGGAPTQATLPGPLATATVRYLEPGSSYKYRIQAVDIAGNTSLVSESLTFTLEGHQETDPAIVYSSGWFQRSHSFAMHGALRATSAANKSARYTFTGKSVAWVATRGADRGFAQVFIDGVLVQTVDLYSPTLQGRRIVFAAINLAPGQHTIEIRTLGAGNPSGSGTRVDLDAILVMT
jgi:hypothetical protein